MFLTRVLISSVFVLVGAQETYCTDHFVSIPPRGTHTISINGDRYEFACRVGAPGELIYVSYSCAGTYLKQSMLTKSASAPSLQVVGEYMSSAACDTQAAILNSRWERLQLGECQPK